MTENDNKMRDHSAWQRELQEALAPLLTDSGAGIVCMRIFYMVRHADDSLSAGQAGLTPEHEVENGMRLISNIVQILRDPEKTAQIQRVKAPDKH